MDKTIKSDKKIILNIAGYLRELYSNYKPEDNFSYSISLDRKNKTIGLKIHRCKEVRKNE